MRPSPSSLAVIMTVAPLAPLQVSLVSFLMARHAQAAPRAQVTLSCWKTRLGVQVAFLRSRLFTSSCAFPFEPRSRVPTVPRAQIALSRSKLALARKLRSRALFVRLKNQGAISRPFRPHAQFIILRSLDVLECFSCVSALFVVLPQLNTLSLAEALRPASGLHFATHVGLTSLTHSKHQVESSCAMSR